MRAIFSQFSALVLLFMRLVRKLCVGVLPIAEGTVGINKPPLLTTLLVVSRVGEDSLLNILTPTSRGLDAAIPIQAGLDSITQL